MIWRKWQPRPADTTSPGPSLGMTVVTVVSAIAGLTALHVVFVVFLTMYAHAVWKLAVWTWHQWP